MAGEFTPEWFGEAGEDEYAAALVELVAEVRPEAAAVYVDGIAGYLSTPIAAEVLSLGAAFEGATGISLGELAELATSSVALAQATSPGEIISAATQLMNAAGSAASAAAQAAGVAGGAMATIPLISAFVGGVGMFAGAVQDSVDRLNQLADKCQRSADANRDAFCRELVNSTRPTPTGRATGGQSGLRPTDAFRALAYEWRRPAPGRLIGRWGHRRWGSNAAPTEPGYLVPPPEPLILGGLTDRGMKALRWPTTYGMWSGERWIFDPRPAWPPSIASVFVGLCGGAARFPPGPIFVDVNGRMRPPTFFSPWAEGHQAGGSLAPAANYEAFCASTGVEPIPGDIQQRMWSAVRTLMLGARDPRRGEHGATDGEDGTAAFSILVDLVYKQRAAGRVPDELLAAISRDAMHWTMLELNCEKYASDEIAAHAPIIGQAGCHNRVDLVTPVVELLLKYDAQLPYLMEALAHDPAPPPRLRIPGGGLALFDPGRRPTRRRPPDLQARAAVGGAVAVGAGAAVAATLLGAGSAETGGAGAGGALLGAVLLGALGRDRTPQRAPQRVPQRAIVPKRASSSRRG